jgi:SOS response regulatory protein OraA/RecX
LSRVTRKLSRGKKKSARTLALKIIHAMDGRDKMRRSELVQNLQAKGYSERQINALIKKLHDEGVINSSVGKYSVVTVV